MPIVFQQPSPVGAAGAVGAAQGAAAARGQNLQAQIAAGNLYAQHAARMAAIEEQSAGRFQSASMLGAQLGERGFEAQMDFANQRAREQAQAVIEQMQGQFLLQRQREANAAQLRERAIAEGELTPAEEQQLSRYESGLAEVRKKVAEGGLRPDQAAPLIDSLMGHVSSLRLRKQLTIEKEKNQEIQEAQRKAGLFSSIQNANAQGAAMNWDKFKVGIDPATGDHAGWINPFDGKFIEKPKEPAPKEQKPAITPQMAMKLYSDAEKEVSIRHQSVTDPAERQRLIDEEYIRRLGKLQAIAGGKMPGGGGGGEVEKPSINFADQAELGKAEIANNPAIPQEIKVAAANAIDDAKRLLEAVGWDVNKLSKADREKYDRLKNFVRSLPRAPQQPQPQQAPMPPQPQPAGPGEAVPGLSTGFGPADWIRRQIGG